MENTTTLETFKRSDIPRHLLVGPDFKSLYLAMIWDWSVILLCWYGMISLPTSVFPILGLLIAGRLHAFGVIIHDLSHMNLERKGLKIRTLEFFCGYIIGTSANAMAYHHLRHHRHTLSLLDPYYNLSKKSTGLKRFILTFKKGLFFIPFWVARTFFAPVALLFPKTRNFYGRFFLQDVSGLDLTQSKEITTCVAEDLFILVFHLSLFFVSYVYFPFLFIGYYLLAPIAGVLCIYRLLIEHEYDLIENKTTYKLIETTFDHHTQLLERILIGPHNVGYHCMHHIHPSVGFQALPKLRKWYLQNSRYYVENMRASL